MASGSIRGRLLRSSLYTFGCLEAPRESSSHQLQGSGFSRNVCCNEPGFQPIKYCSNYISTTKYNAITFLPKALFEQLRRAANLYFLLSAALSLTPILSFSPITTIAPFVFLIGVSMAKEAVENWHRFMQDVKVNMQNVMVHSGDGVFAPKPWMKVEVGDVVKVVKDDFFPSDLLLLSSSYEDGICYVETLNLDGETNLKVKRCLEVTLPLNDDAAFKDFKATIKCEDPNPDLYTFVGNFEYNSQTYPLDPNQILLRDSKLRNTTHVYGVVIFSGHDTKVMQNATKLPSKRSTIEKRMDKIVSMLFVLLVLISLISSVGFAIKTGSEMRNWSYMPYDTNILYDSHRILFSTSIHLITALTLFGYLIPISLYVSIELVKVLQAFFINQDRHMYDDKTRTLAQSRTSNINEELGMVDTILSDKTGTLTCNQMDFLKCSIAGVPYGMLSHEEVEQLANATSSTINAGQRAIELDHGGSEIELETLPTDPQTGSSSHHRIIKGFSFKDSRLMNGNWLREPNADIVLLFFRILALCHTAVPELNEEDGTFTYETESPDEGAFLVAAREFGFEYCKRTQSSVFIRERHPPSHEPVEREFKLLNLLDFTSKRKRMSVIVQDETGEILLLCKGADSIIYDRLSKNGSGRSFEEATIKHLKDYGEAGLRTLAFAYRKLQVSEYSTWNDEFVKAKTSIGADRDAMLQRLSDMIETDLILVGATAVEDKLQEGVPQCIDKLSQAGLKIWVLTGDKMETAINIGFACCLLRQGMKQIYITTNDDDNQEVVKENILMQISKANEMVKYEKDPDVAFALIIDGRTLTYALEDNLKQQFLNLAIDCASVICCRVSPKQKALVTRLVKRCTRKTTLAIGDGANDVGMIQEADIGIGISGAEGMQAVMASDFAIAQFRFLERLLLVHGHWCYKRMAQMICYFFYKNIAFGLTLFYYEAFTGFSGQSIYDAWYMLLFNVVLTSLPGISLGIFEQDVSAEACLQFPPLYQQGPRNRFFNWYRIFGWLGNSLHCSLVVFFFNIFIFYDQAFRADGQTADMAVVGTTMFTCVIYSVNCQIALMMSHFTWIQHVLIGFSIGTWHMFLILYGTFSPQISKNVYKIFMEALAPAPDYWLTILLVVVASNLPYVVYVMFQRSFKPMDHQVIQESSIRRRV